MSSALYCEFSLNNATQNIQDDDFVDTNWYGPYTDLSNVFLYSLNALSAFLSLGVAIFIFSTPRRDSYIFQTLAILFFTTSIFQVAELLQANATVHWGNYVANVHVKDGDNAVTCEYDPPDGNNVVFTTFHPGESSKLYIMGSPTFYLVITELLTSYLRNVIAMFQISLCRVLRQTISDATYRNQTDKVISLTRILKVVKENYSRPLLIILPLFPIYFFLYSTQICYSTFNSDGQEGKNRWNNLIYLILFPIGVIIEFYLPFKSIQINFQLYSECVMSYREAVRMAKIKGILQRRVEENIRLMQGYPTINAIAVTSIIISSLWRFCVILIFEIFYKNSMECSESSYCRWNCYVNGFVYFIGFSIQAAQGTMEFTLYSWHRSTRKWLQMQIDDFKRIENKIDWQNYLKAGRCCTDCFQRLSWIIRNICLGKIDPKRESSRITYDSGYYTNDKLYMDDTDEPDSFNNPLHEEQVNLHL